MTDKDLSCIIGTLPTCLSEVRLTKRADLMTQVTRKSAMKAGITLRAYLTIMNTRKSATKTNITLRAYLMIISMRIAR